MEASIVLRGGQRNALLSLYRQHPDAAVRLRAHIILLLAAAQPWSLIVAVLFCSSATIARTQKAFVAGGVPALQASGRGRKRVFGGVFLTLVLEWVQHCSPRDFGFLRSRWCCGTLVLLLVETTAAQVSAETVRRWLHAGGMVWRRPRPVIGRKDPRWKQILTELREVLGELPADQIAVFSDEVDLNTNPKLGCMWMKKGRQAKVITPGDNAKRYCCGSMSFLSGQILASTGAARNAELFLAHLDQLRRCYRHYRVIHVICDNAGFHRPDKCKAVAQYLEQWGDRVKLHYLPKYAPETNPIERVWWHLHEEVTRNHRCQSIGELVDLALQWLEERGPFQIEGHLYENLRKAAAA
jgi:putative transposase